MAYQSSVSGTHEIYVRPFPNVDDGLWPITNGGGEMPIWAPDGSELFFVSDGLLYATPVETEPTFVPGKPEAVFGGFYADYYSPTYDVSPDGQRFLVLKEPAAEGPVDLLVVLNFLEELKRLVPVEQP